MPTYEYQCRACGKRFEKFQPITAAPIRKCPACGRRKVRRLIGPGAGILFKGSGFYQTDYRSDAYRKAAEKEKPAQAAASTSASSDAGAAGDGAKKTPGVSAPTQGKKKPSSAGGGGN